MRHSLFLAQTFIVSSWEDIASARSEYLASVPSVRSLLVYADVSLEHDEEKANEIISRYGHPWRYEYEKNDVPRNKSCFSLCSIVPGDIAVSSLYELEVKDDDRYSSEVSVRPLIVSDDCDCDFEEQNILYVRTNFLAYPPRVKDAYDIFKNKASAAQSCELIALTDGPYPMSSALEERNLMDWHLAESADSGKEVGYFCVEAIVSYSDREKAIDELMLSQVSDYPSPFAFDVRTMEMVPPSRAGRSFEIF